ncbi:MAG: primosomal protein N' [Clostridia bacterium]|nr:primosomal protein N' [Clostridia bacterium]
MELKTVSVVLDGAVGSYDKPYSYFVPKELESKAKKGSRVTVPFGNGNIKKQGLIIEESKLEYCEKIKYIIDVNDNSPILDEEMLSLCLFMKERFFCTFFDAVNTILPAGYKLRLENFFAVNGEFIGYNCLSEKEKEIYDFVKKNDYVSQKKIKSALLATEEDLNELVKKEALFVSKEPIRRIGDKTAKYVRITEEDFDSCKLTERQREIAEAVRNIGAVSVKELVYFTGVTMSVINALEKKKIVEVFDKQVFRIPFKPKDRADNEIILNEEQQKAFSDLQKKYKSGKESVSLIYGVTGSGKTNVYMKLCENAVKDNKGVIVMVPEIALTPQMISLFSSRFGSKIAVLHSAMSLGQRMDEYSRLKNGTATIAIGTRSAVFAPVKNLGLIIIDEEHEHTYKSEQSPRYNAKDIAKFRANYNKCLLVLSSATPSLESYSYALSGRYGLNELNHRYNGAKLPDVTVVDMRNEINAGNKSNISRYLAQKTEECLENNKQAIILLNRRGHNTHISCPSCGYIAVCENCSVSLTYHSANKRLMCHYCGHSEPIFDKCPKCGNEYLSFGGVGTQKLEEELKLLFPKARIVRLDADSTLSKDAFSEKLTAFSNKEYDILIGTQMVAKGLDFPDVNLVGVVGADRAFYSDDYRGFERTFSLLTQVIGRAGRAGDQAEAVIQTLNTEDDVITLAANQDYKSFYNEEMLTRKLMIYPPFCDICMVASSSADKTLAQEAANEILKNIKSNTENEYSDVKLIILGPMPAAVVKVNGKYRYRMIIKFKNSKQSRELIRKSINIKKKRDLSVFVDINPENIL